MMARFATLAGAAGALACMAPACADVTFAEIAEIARAAYPGLPLVDIRYRDRGDERFYTTSSLNEFNTLFYTLEIDADTLAFEAGDIEEILPPADLETAGVLARLGELEVGFAEAIAAAHAATGRTDADLYRVGLSSDAFMILYDLQYLDDTRVLVDGATGQVLTQGEEPNGITAVPNAEVVAAIARAQALAGPTWHPFDSEVFLTDAGAAWSVYFVTPANGRVKQVDFVGATEEINQYTPIGRLAERAAEVRAQLSTVVVTVEQFLADIEANEPGALVAGVSLDSRTRDGETRTRWSAMLLTTQGAVIDYAIDATLPVGSGLRFVRLAAPRIEGDLTGDGRVQSDDLALFFNCFGTDYPPCDFDRDGCVSGADLTVLMRNWN